jgi:hypothetical protein
MPIRRRRPRGRNRPGGMPRPHLGGGIQPPLGGPAAGSFLPMTPQYEATRRGAEDQRAASLADIAYQRAQIPGAVNMFGARQATDLGQATNLFNDQIVGRGLWNSGIRPQQYQEQVTTPFSRNQQDFQLQMEQLANELAFQEGQVGLSYNQALSDALQQRAGDVAQQMPYGLPGQYAGRPNTPKRPRRNRPRRRRR